MRCDFGPITLRAARANLYVRKDHKEVVQVCGSPGHDSRPASLLTALNIRRVTAFKPSVQNLHWPRGGLGTDALCTRRRGA